MKACLPRQLRLFICTADVFLCFVFFSVSLKVWMLTGDKLETATCTAKNAHLITRNQDIHIFRPVSAGVRPL